MASRQGGQAGRVLTDPPASFALSRLIAKVYEVSPRLRRELVWDIVAKNVEPIWTSTGIEEHQE